MCHTTDRTKVVVIFRSNGKKAGLGITRGQIRTPLLNTVTPFDYKMGRS